MKSKYVGFLQHYYVAFVVTAIIFVLTLIFGGFSSLLPLIALAVIEVTFSFENAVINSQVLGGMNKFWRTVFLTVGIAVAVFGVRLILPLVLVSSSSGTTLSHVLDLALNQPDLYAEKLHAAYPVIAAFGGVFLLMIGLRFFGEKRDVMWLDKVEAPLAVYNQPWSVSIAGALIATGFIYFLMAPGDKRVAIAAIAGALTFMAIKVISALLLRRKLQAGLQHAEVHGWAAFMQFMYLELLDASFSFDGVIAAFAITKDVLLIAAGLGIGALYVRSITIHLLKRQTLTHYRYLIHGAHYAITALAIMLIASMRIHIPEVITGMFGLIIIGLSFESSRRHKSSTSEHAA